MKKIAVHNARNIRDYQVSLSVGTACSDPDNHFSIDEMMPRADALMYEQKRSKLA